MIFDTNLFRHRAIINTNAECFGVKFTHWGTRRKSWAAKWDDVVAINAIGVESPEFTLGLEFILAGNYKCFLSDDMENWETLIDCIRKRHAHFNWVNLDEATHYENRNQSFQCWLRPS